MALSFTLFLIWCIGCVYGLYMPWKKKVCLFISIFLILYYSSSSNSLFCEQLFSKKDDRSSQQKLHPTNQPTNRRDVHSKRLGFWPTWLSESTDPRRVADLSTLLDAKTTNIRNNSSAIRALEATHFAIDTLGKSRQPIGKNVEAIFVLCFGWKEEKSTKYKVEENTIDLQSQTDKWECSKKSFQVEASLSLGKNWLDEANLTSTNSELRRTTAKVSEQNIVQAQWGSFDAFCGRCYPSQCALVLQKEPGCK